MSIRQSIDHTLLKPDATAAEIETLCRQAVECGFATVCVNPCHVAFCARLLVNTPVAVATVIGFPLGATLPVVKQFEAAAATNLGASEIDMVLNIGALKDGNTALVRKDITAVVKAVSGKAIVKVILETALLTRDEIILACQLAMESGADYVKTSTGFGGKGATVEDVALISSIVKPQLRVKASGGIRDLATAQNMIAAGADRIGTSAGVAISCEEQETSDQGQQ